MNFDLRGCGTALVTPFQRDGSLDIEALRRLVRFQLDEGIHFLVPCGTTGETPTLEREEYLDVIRIVLEEVKGRVPVIPGVTGNSTAKVVQMAQEVATLGVQGILSAAPYYNKPTQEGIYQHFKAIAEAVDLPIILYNVPGRTSSNIEPATVARLAKISNIAGIKEASGSITQQMDVLAMAPSAFRVLSGDDAFTFPLMALGGVGIISVASNEVPGAMSRLAQLMLDGRVEEARKLHFHLLPLMQANFIESSPIPVKAALAMMGLIEEAYRLPLVRLKDENRGKLECVLEAQGLLKSRVEARRSA
ncbi:MAG TPA: 4-hydroxy-tetrahydrodipicolinate synthase [Terriglobia bacterium]|nr:4-hydroxy-tetrahydrodipicolinate synthase [Terriglobia bacterium]